MPALPHLPRGCASALALALLCSLVGGVARAGEVAPAGVMAAASAAVPAAASATATKAEASPQLPAAARVAPDPMERLRARLAQRLGAMSAPDPAHPDVLRIVSRAHVPIAVEVASASASASEPASTAAAHGAHPTHPARRRPASAAAAHANAPAVAWDYAGRGSPDAWGRLKPEFATCANGTRQSPIDIRDGIKVELAPIRFDYQPSAFGVIDDGHTVQVNVAPGSSIEVLGRRYALVQFHFHRPSEERIDGKPFDMVVHLVHRDSEGRIAIVAVLLERGSAQKVVQNVWNNLPLEQGAELAAPGVLNPNELLPTERSYYTYMGSLTTPPCTESVLWMVMKTPVPISAEQIAVFAHLYPMNARPIQPAGGRLIKESN